jgi:hypothetical protein
VIANKRKIFFEFFPVRVSDFAILNIESEKRKISPEGAPKSAPFDFCGQFTNSYRVLAMIKRKAKKSKKASSKDLKKTAKKKKSRKSKPGKKERDAKEVRHECSKLVKEDAREVTVAVIGEAKKGQLGPMKYLFEMANIFPQADDGSQTSAEEDSLAETLLTRLGIPTHPVVADEYEKAANEVIPVGLAWKEDGEDETEPEKVELEAAPDAMIGCE